MKEVSKLPLLIVALGVIFLLILMIPLKFNGFIALIIVAILVGLFEGMPLHTVMESISDGIGDN